jgi:hypothetical protein
MEHLLQALSAGLSSPENDEDQTAANGLVSKGQVQGAGCDSAAEGCSTQGCEAKVFATLQARAALAGFELVRMADGSFVVARWTMTRALADVPAVESFLKQVGAA